MVDFALYWDNENGTGADISVCCNDIELTQDLAGDLRNATYIILFCDALAPLDAEIPDGSDNRRGYWADAFSDAGETGSLLWLLSREKASDAVLRRARQYATSALAQLIDEGVVVSTDVVAEYRNGDELWLFVTHTLKGGESIVIEMGCGCELTSEVDTTPTADAVIRGLNPNHYWNANHTDPSTLISTDLGVDEAKWDLWWPPNGQASNPDAVAYYHEAPQILVDYQQQSIERDRDARSIIITCGGGSGPPGAASDIPGCANTAPYLSAGTAVWVGQVLPGEYGWNLFTLGHTQICLGAIPDPYDNNRFRLIIAADARWAFYNDNVYFPASTTMCLAVRWDAETNTIGIQINDVIRNFGSDQISGTLAGTLTWFDYPGSPPGWCRSTLGYSYWQEPSFPARNMRPSKWALWQRQLTNSELSSIAAAVRE